jgi:hypothetical protein
MANRKQRRKDRKQKTTGSDGFGFAKTNAARLSAVFYP